MGMTSLQQIGILPAILITLGGLLVLRSTGDEKARRRLLLYLLIAGVVLLLAFLVALLLTTPPMNQPFWQVSIVLTPVLIGVLALILLQPGQLLAMPWWGRLLALVLAAGLAWLLTSEAAMRWGSSYYLIPGVLVLVLGWVIGRRLPMVAIALALLLLAALFALNVLIGRPAGELAPPPRWLGALLAPIFQSLPALLVVVAAALLANSLQPPRSRRALLPAILALALVAYLAYSVFWASVWDQTSDGLGGLVLSQPSALVAIGAGMVMALTVPGWGRATGLLFAVLVPLLLNQSFEQGWQLSYHELTESRAARIAQALDDYRQREGAYPATLDALAPRYLLRVPQPVELQGEPWCYQGGDDFYRLGAFYREFFSMPVELQLYASGGEPDGLWPCEAQLAAMKERYYSPMEDPQAMRSPVPTPLPPSEAATGAELLLPVLEGSNLVWGSWSPDGAYFLLGQRDDAGSVSLSFLDGRTGELCTVGGAFTYGPFVVNLRPYHAWLPDGQLFLLDESGEIVLVTPCAGGTEPVAAGPAAGLAEVVARSEHNGRLLLKGSGEFWIFDGPAHAWLPVANVTPNPYEAHWDHATWQPGGDLLAISRLNGRDASDGSTLYVVDGATGAVLRTHPLDEATDQSAARVDWLSSQELLLMGSGVLRIIDLSSDPPQTIDVLRDIFELDLSFPDQIWGNGWEVDWENDSYTLTLRANHPRNQAFYLYQSATGTVDVYDEDGNLLLLFPGEKVEMWMKAEMEPAYGDQFVLVDVATGAVHPPLVIGGHTPRDYPHLSMAYLPGPGLLAVASSQGISLHALPDGETTTFWALAGQGFPPYLQPAPDGSALIAIRDQGGLYWLPLP
jgi:hypothetical protein